MLWTDYFARESNTFCTGKHDLELILTRIENPKKHVTQSVEKIMPGEKQHVYKIKLPRGLDIKTLPKPLLEVLSQRMTECVTVEFSKLLT